MAAPDWNCTSHALGGNGYTENMTRFFPHPEGIKPKVKVRFQSWAGRVPGAKHTSVTIEEQDNPTWNGEMWVKLWDDPFKPRYLSQSFAPRKTAGARERAEAWARRVLAEQFPSSQYEHVWPEGE
jgi:hypothetical protein